MLMLALLEGYLGYSLVDDLLSGMGLAIGYSVALSIPFVGAQPRAADLGRAVPGRRRVLVADVHRARASASRSLIGDAARACTCCSSRSRHHTQFRGAPRRRSARVVGIADVPGLGAALARR